MSAHAPEGIALTAAACARVTVPPCVLQALPSHGFPEASGFWKAQAAFFLEEAIAFLGNSGKWRRGYLCLRGETSVPLEGRAFY